MQAVAVALVFMTLLLKHIFFLIGLFFFNLGFFLTLVSKTWYSKENNLSLPEETMGLHG